MKILNREELYAMRNDELKKLILSLRSRIKEAESSKKASRSKSLIELQTYYCYVYRELEHRGVV